MSDVTVLVLLRDVTIGSAITAALVLLARLIFGKLLNAKIKYYLWLLLALRLLMPVTPGSPVSFMNYVPRSGMAQHGAAPESAYAVGLGSGPESPGQDAADPLPEPSPDQGLPDWTDAALGIWIIGIGGMLSIYLLLYIVTEQKLMAMPECEDEETRRAFLHLRQKLRVSDRIRLVYGEAGMLGGLFHPTLVLPVEKRAEDAVPILAHELMHYKYGDLWLYTLFRLLTAVYWFNPVVWLCFLWARQDSEKACDYRVMETNLVSPYDYAGTLYAEGQCKWRPFLQTTFGDGRHNLKRRIKAISRYRKQSRRKLTAQGILSGVLAVCITACGVLSVETPTNASSPEQSELSHQTGYTDIDSYVEALQPEYGHFGWTFQEHVDAGLLKESDGHWEDETNFTSVFVTEQELLGAPMTVTYVFSVTLFTEETTWRQVLTEIHVKVPEDGNVNDLGNRLLEDWQALNASNEFVGGAFRSPVSVGEYLDGDHWDRVGELAVQDGRAETQEQGWSILQNWSFAALVYWPSRNSWQLNGTGMALYLTRGDYS